MQEEVEEEEEEEDCGAAEISPNFLNFFLPSPVQIPSPFIANCDRLHSVQAVEDSSTLAIVATTSNRLEPITVFTCKYR